MINKGASATFEQLNQYFTICNMPIVASQYWNSVHGFTPDDVRKDKEGLQTMRTLGQNMAWLLKCIESGKQNGIKKPEYEARVRTHFIQGEFYQFNLSSCIRQQNSLTAQFVSFSLSNLANIFYPPNFYNN